MSARQFFTAKNSPTLSPWDRSVLNRATRNLFAPSQDITHMDLMTVRMAYERGMSALDLMTAVELLTGEKET